MRTFHKRNISGQNLPFFVAQLVGHQNSNLNTIEYIVVYHKFNLRVVRYGQVELTIRTHMHSNIPAYDNQ